VHLAGVIAINRRILILECFALADGNLRASWREIERQRKLPESSEKFIVIICAGRKGRRRNQAERKAKPHL
jgi:hypothetical protein